MGGNENSSLWKERKIPGRYECGKDQEILQDFAKRAKGEKNWKISNIKNEGKELKKM